MSSPLDEIRPNSVSRDVWLVVQASKEHFAAIDSKFEAMRTAINQVNSNAQNKIKTMNDEIDTLKTKISVLEMKAGLSQSGNEGMDLLNSLLKGKK